MSTETIEPEEIIHKVMQAALAGVAVSFPAYIVSWDALTNAGRCAVQPIVRGTRLDFDEDAVTYQPPVIENVPLIWPRVAGMAQTWPLSTVADVGILNADTVLVLTCDRSLDEWLTYGGPDVEPRSPRRHDVTDSVALVGMWPFLDAFTAPTDRMRIGQYPILPPRSVGPARIEITDGDPGKIALKNNTVDAMDMLWRTIQALSTAYAIPATGVLMFVPPGGPAIPLNAAFAALEVLISTLKE